jgi:hypothetical protein
MVWACPLLVPLALIGVACFGGIVAARSRTMLRPALPLPRVPRAPTPAHAARSAPLGALRKKGGLPSRTMLRPKGRPPFCALYSRHAARGIVAKPPANCQRQDAGDVADSPTAAKLPARPKNDSNYKKLNPKT